MAEVNKPVNLIDVKNYCELCELSFSKEGRERYKGGCFCVTCSCIEYRRSALACFQCSQHGKFYKSGCPLEKHPKTSRITAVDCLMFKEFVDEKAKKELKQKEMKAKQVEDDEKERIEI